MTFRDELAHDRSFSHEEVGKSWEMLAEGLHRSSLRWWATWRVAAAAMLVGLLSAGGFWLRGELRTHRFASPAGTLTHLTLPDGSEVTLNGNSTLRYVGNWQKDAARQVWLEGEAFFSVTERMAPDGKVKFLVHTDDLRVEVVGTRFNVEQRHDRAAVVLASGQVRLGLADRPEQPVVEMVPGDRVAYSDGQLQLEVERVVPDRFTAWRNQVLVLDRTSVREFARILEGTYGLKVHIKDPSLADVAVTGTIQSQDLTTLLEVFSATTGLRTQRRGNHLTLY